MTDLIHEISISTDTDQDPTDGTQLTQLENHDQSNAAFTSHLLVRLKQTLL